MQLEKYYLDVVRADGGGCLGYAAHLDGFGFAATIAATLRWEADAAIAPEHQRTLRGTLPVAVDAGVSWHCPALGVAGTWMTKEPASAEHVLWRDARGELSWRVLAPRAKIDLQFGGTPIEGWGYAERLRVNVAPWHLPIDALRWGRFVAPAHSVVWVEWEHALPRRWLWHNGEAQAEFRLTDDRVEWPGGCVAFGASRALRTGRLADTAFARWPRVQRWLPKKIQALDEAKWCAPAVLIDATDTRAFGWVMHERVRFR